MKKLKALILTLCLFLSACNSIEIYTGLSEEQANLMLSTLLKRGIEAEKQALGKEGYAISVNPDQMVQALEILKDNSLPREDFQNLGSIFSGQSMIASAGEEKSRFAYAISQELSDTFSHIDGVLSARVHLVLSDIDTVTNTVTKASASVFLRHTADSPIVNLVPKVKEITAGAVAGLDVNNVAVMLVPARDNVTVPIVQKQKSFNLFSEIDKLNMSFLALAFAFALIINALFLLLNYIIKKRKAHNSKENTD